MSFKQTLLNALGTLGRFLSILFKDTLRKELEIILPIAIGAVTSVANDPTLLKSGAKQDAAAALILAELAKKQVEIGKSVINLGIELALQNVRSSGV